MNLLVNSIHQCVKVQEVKQNVKGKFRKEVDYSFLLDAMDIHVIEMESHEEVGFYERTKTEELAVRGAPVYDAKAERKLVRQRVHEDVNEKKCGHYE